MQNLLSNAEKTHSDPTVTNKIEYLSAEEWETATREQKLRWISSGVTVVKHRLNYFQGGDNSVAQKQFDKGSSKRDEPLSDALLRLGLEPRSEHQVVGKPPPFQSHA